jgi:RND family efflux transporter MFP subunit
MEMETPNSSNKHSVDTVSMAKRALTFAVCVVACLAVLVAYGIYSRAHAEAALASATEASAVLHVRTVQPKQGAPSEDLVLPGNIEAYNDTPIYARTSGYVKRWYVDIGAHVKAGQLLAEIETPEVDQQLHQARAQLATAQADSRLAKSTADRWKNLRKTDSVSPQEAEEKSGDMESKAALEDAARANVRRLEELQGFKKIYAPFSGVITARNVDIGDLINAGSTGTAKELFHLAAVQQMRVYLQVPQVNARAATPGTEVQLALPEAPGKLITAHITRTSDAIDPSARTLRVEVDVPNPGSTLVPGEYVQVHLKLPTPANALIVPVNGVLFRSEGITAAVVHGDHVELQSITIGRDFGDELEVTSGLAANDRVVINPPDSLVSGQKVEQAQAGAQ